MYCNQEIETMPRTVMHRLQTEKLQKVIRWAYGKSAFYREQMRGAGLTDQSIETLEDLTKMPFTTRAHLSQHSPFGFLTVPLSNIIRMRMVGEDEPVTRAYTSGDIGRNVEMMARCLVAGGLNMASILQIFGEYSKENTLSIQYAGELLGATVIPSAIEKLDRCLMQTEKFGVNSIAANAQRILQLLVAGQALNYDMKKMKISTVFLTNSAVKNNMEDHVSGRFNARIYNLYSPPEVGCPGMMFDCGEKAGMHIQEDYFYSEVISLNHHGPVENGHVGELVITSLGLEAMPFIRYRTGQVVSMDREVCSCGRTLARIKVP